MNNCFEALPQRNNSYKWKDLKYEDTLSLDIADMDFNLSNEILSKFKERIERGSFGYEFEGECYYDAICAWYKRNHNLKIEKKWIVSTPGVINGIKTCVNAFSKKGDAVMVLSPLYHSYVTATEGNERRVVYCDMVYDNGTYQVDFGKLTSLIETEKVKIFIFCNPNNPTGKVFSKEEIKKILGICEENDVLVISDEVYEDFIFEGNTFHSCIEYKHKCKKLIVAKSLCKTFNVAGIQVANFLIYNDSLREQYKREKSKRSYMANNAMGIAMTENLYTYGDNWHRECFDYIIENMDIFKKIIKEKYPDISICKSQSLYMLWIDFSKVLAPSIDIEKFFLDKMHLKIANGERFGKEGQYKNFVRINFACPRFIVLEMIKRMDEALKKYERKI